MRGGIERFAKRCDRLFDEIGLLIIELKSPLPVSGEIVVAMVEGEATVKTFRPERGPSGPRIRLEPANAAMRPIVLDPSSGAVAILGKVVGVVRTY